MLALIHTPGPPPIMRTVTSGTLSVLRDGLTNCIVEFALQTCSVLRILYSAMESLEQA
jgi:hypothetical protein